MSTYCASLHLSLIVAVASHLCLCLLEFCLTTLADGSLASYSSFVLYKECIQCVCCWQAITSLIYMLACSPWFGFFSH